MADVPPWVTPPHIHTVTLPDLSTMKPGDSYSVKNGGEHPVTIETCANGRIALLEPDEEFTITRNPPDPPK